MATYKEIKGITVQTRDADPVVNAGSWSCGGDLNVARYQGGGAGVQTAASLFGGYGSPDADHEYYNGSTWSEQTNLNSGRKSAGSGGVQTASILFAGYTTTNVNNVETWNGSSWTEVAEVNTTRRGISSLGQTNTAILAVGGYTTTAVDNVESWNGSAWTEIAEILSPGYSAAGSGTSTEGLIINSTPGVTNQYWNGSSWAEQSDTNTEHSPGGGGSQQGSYTSALIFGGGNPTSLAVTESWDGSSWTEVADLATARRGIRGAGTASSGLAMGGEIPPTVASTEEFSFPPPTAAILNEGDLFLSGGTTLKGFGKFAGVPTATWASVADLNAARGQPGTGAGSTSTNCLVIGGYDNPPLQYKANIENFDGSSWTELNDLSEGRQFGNGGGTRTSAIIFGGTDGSAVASTELFDGTNASTAADLNTARYVQGGASQINTAALCFGGYTGTANTANTENWNGSSWTEVNNINNTRSYINGAGTPTNAIAISGEPTPRNYVESWDGTSWTEIAEINTARAQGGCSGFGTNTNVIFFGGEPGSQTKTELWNGSSWTEVNDLGTARTTPGGAGTSIAGMAMGGNPTKSSAEEFTADSTLADVTVS